MFSFVKKDLLIFWRDRRELITILTLPILLVVVLNFAFAGLLGKDGDQTMDLQLAIVDKDENNKQSISTQLKNKLIQQASFSEEDATELVGQLSEKNPAALLINFLESSELKELVSIHQLKEEEAIAKVEEGELDGILIIPDGFTVNSLFAAIVSEPPATKLRYKVAKDSNETSTISNIMNNFLENMNYQFALQEVGSMETDDILLPEGGYEEIGSGQHFTLSQYFTIAMGALFTLFIAATIATKTGTEIRQHVFERIILSNNNPIHFLFGKMVATFLLAWLQIVFVFVFSHLILNVFSDRSVYFWLGIVSIITVLSIAIAGLAALFTTISLRVKNIDAANGIFTVIILLFGVVGGNFVPIYVLPSWLIRIGEWTPNGLSLVMFTEWIQFEKLSHLVIPCIILICFFLLCTVISLTMFPKGGKQSEKSILGTIYKG